MATSTARRWLIGQWFLAGALVSSAPAFASTPSVPGAPAAIGAASEADVGLQLIVGGIELEPITAMEIAGGSNLPEPAPRLQIRADGHRLRAEGGITIAPSSGVIRREIRGLWRYGRPAEGKRGEPRIRVELEGANGSLVSVEDGVTRLPVRLQPLRPGKRVGDGVEVYEGDVVLEIPVEALAKPGRYRGQIRITVEEI